MPTKIYEQNLHMQNKLRDRSYFQQRERLRITSHWQLLVLIWLGWMDG